MGTVTVRVRSIVWFVGGALIALVVLWLFQAWRVDALGDGESTFVPIEPCRVIDLRPDFQVGDRDTALGADESLAVKVTGSEGNCSGIPTDITGVAMNVTVTDPTAPSFLAVVPGDLTGNPGVSSLNYLAGAPPTPNKVDVGVDGEGQVRFYNRAGSVFVLADVVGYYTDTGLTDLEARLEVLEAGGLPQAALDRLDALEADNTALRSKVAALETKTASLSASSIDGRPTVRFTGVNVQVVDGSGDTDGGVNGLGNVFIGYNEDIGTDGTDERTGSHNLVIGDEHAYTSSGGLVAGLNNSITGRSASVSGGSGNTAAGRASSVSGGLRNDAIGSESAVSGGTLNSASGLRSSVSGGVSNIAEGSFSSVLGGRVNSAAGTDSSVSGGTLNTASGSAASVTAGSNNAAGGVFSSVSGGDGNEALVANSSILGGRANRTANNAGPSIGGGDDILCGRPWSMCGEGAVFEQD